MLMIIDKIIDKIPKNKGIILIKQDKGRGVVILDKKISHRKMH